MDRNNYGNVRCGMALAEEGGCCHTNLKASENRGSSHCAEALRRCPKYSVTSFAFRVVYRGIQHTAISFARYR